MFAWIYDRLTNEFLYGGPCEQSYDPATQGLVRLSRNPKSRQERYDGAGGIRSATAQEIADYDAARLTRQAGDRADDLALRGLAAYVVQELNVVRAALPVPLPALTVQTARAFALNFVKVRL